MRRFVAAGAVVLTLLAACGGGGSDGLSEDEVRERLKIITDDVDDDRMEEFEELADDHCSEDEDVMELTYAMLLDDGGAAVDGYRLGVEWKCPDRLEVLDEVENL